MYWIMEWNGKRIQLMDLLIQFTNHRCDQYGSIRSKGNVNIQRHFLQCNVVFVVIVIVNVCSMLVDLNNVTTTKQYYP